MRQHSAVVVGYPTCFPTFSIALLVSRVPFFNVESVWLCLHLSLKYFYIAKFSRSKKAMPPKAKNKGKQRQIDQPPQPTQPSVLAQDDIDASGESNLREAPTRQRRTPRRGDSPDEEPFSTAATGGALMPALHAGTLTQSEQIETAAYLDKLEDLIFEYDESCKVCGQELDRKDANAVGNPLIFI